MEKNYYKFSSTLQVRITQLQGKNFVLFNRERKKNMKCMHLL